MSVVAVAVGGSAVLSYMGGREAQDRADDRADDANAVAGEQLQFNREVHAWERSVYEDEREYVEGQRARYNEIYGDIEENLGEFFEQLTPEFIESAGLQANAKEFSKARKNIKQNIAQRNIDGAGVELSEMSKADVAEAEANAQTRIEAPLKVAEMKQNFVNRAPAIPGMPGNRPNGAGVSNAMGNLANNLTNQSITAQNNANSMYQSAGQMLSTGLMYAGQTHYNPGSASGGGTVVTDYSAPMQVQEF